MKKVKDALTEIKKNIKSRKKTDRIMWFSMWTALSVATFGLAWFPMIYYSIKRRNDHFSRQEKLEKLILKLLKNKKDPKNANFFASKQDLKPLIKNNSLLTISTLLIFPAFYLFYSLKVDLQKHENHEHRFIQEINSLAKNLEIPLNIQNYFTKPNFPIKKYVILSILTMGLAAAYWLYRIFNDYNNHFKMQWIIEDELLRFLKTIDQKSN
jgi:hypothetical protein